MAQTTIVPFATLPACATSCGPLYDANGGCVPPIATTADVNNYQACFCQHTKVTGLAGGPSDVCNGLCGADVLSTIHTWFTGMCNGKAVATQATTGTAASGSSTNKSSSNQQSGDWLSTHWKWVIMIVVIFVGIVGIWVGAFIWRRKYLKKKDRMYELGKGLPSNIAVNTQGNLVGTGVNNLNDRGSGQPMLGSGPPQGGYYEKPKKERKRWNVSERT